MSNILFAWELGDNWGHLSRDLPIAKRLRADQHEVLCAVCDTRMAAELLQPEAIPFVQAPISRRVVKTTQVISGYAEMLLASGYAEVETLRGLISGWLTLFDLFHPDILIIDYAPTALLAAHIAGIKTVLIGNGFELPPRSLPLPPFPNATKTVIPQERLLLAESLTLRNINHVMAYFKASSITHLGDLFQSKYKAITTFAELDPYGIRSNENYTGPIYEVPRALTMSWQIAESVKIFAYLRPWMPGIDSLLLALHETDAEVICAFPGAPQELIQRFQTSRLRIVQSAVAIEPLLLEANLVIGYGSGIVAVSLLAGVPVFLVPRWSEQYLTACRVEGLGAGFSLTEKPTKEAYSLALNKLLGDAGFKTAAEGFAIKYLGFSREGAIEQVTNVIQCALTQKI